MNEDFRPEKSEILQMIEAPEPSPYHRSDVIDEVATRLNHRYRIAACVPRGHPVDVIELLGMLGIKLEYEFIDEPEGSYLFANYSEEDGERLIIVNENHRDFFNQHPIAFKQTIGHEIAHSVLKHIRYGERPVGTPSLFDDPPRRTRTFHQAGLPHYALDKETYLKFKATREKAIGVLSKWGAVFPDLRKTLSSITSKFEPDWMFWQAEYFSLCLHTPRDMMMEELERPLDFTSWGAIYRLADKYVVTPSMMKRRLVKMGIIEVDKDGKLRIPRSNLQPRLNQLGD